MAFATIRMTPELRGVLSSAANQKYPRPSEVPPRDFEQEARTLTESASEDLRHDLGDRIPRILQAILETSGLMVERISVEWKNNILKHEPMGLMLAGLKPDTPAEVIVKFGRRGPRAVLRLYLAQSTLTAPHIRDALLKTLRLGDRKDLQPYFIFEQSDARDLGGADELGASLQVLDCAVKWYGTREFKRVLFAERLYKCFPKLFSSTEKVRHSITCGHSLKWFESVELVQP